MRVEVVYGLPERQVLVELHVPDDCTVEQAVQQSNLMKQFPEIDLSSNKMGVFSKPVKRDTRLRPGDRVEIYRPLLIDPKAARLLRAKKA